MFRFPYILVFIFGAFSLFLFQSCTSSGTHRSSAVKGVLDLSSYDFKKDGSVALSGEWEFYPGVLLTPADFDSTAPMPEFTHLPGSWRGAVSGDSILPAFGFGSYRLNILLNKNAGSLKEAHLILGLKIIEIHSAYNVYIDSINFEQQGNVTADAEVFIPLIHPQTFFFNPERDTVTILISVANYFDPKMAGIDDFIFLGTDADIIRESNSNLFLFIFAFGILVIMGIFNLLIYIIRTSDKLNLYLSVMCFLFAVQALWEGEKAVYSFLPGMNAELYFTIWLLTLNLFPLVVHFYTLLFPEEFSKRFSSFLWILFAVYSLLVITLPYSAAGGFIDYFFIIGLCLLIYVLIGLVRAFRHHRPFSAFAFFGLLLPLAVSLNDILFALDVIVTAYYAPIGFVFYAVVQSTLLSKKFADAFDRSIELGNQLTAINENLESTVALRTRELFSVNENLREANLEKDKFFSILAHDLRNPFSAVIGLSKELYQHSDLLSETERLEFAQMIYDSSLNSYKLLENLLQWAKIHLGKHTIDLDVCLLSEIVEQNQSLFSVLTSSKKILFSVNIPASLAVVSDRFSIDTVLRNLISNAVKYTPFFGKITVTARAVENGVVVSVTDTGIGISKDIAGRLFKIDREHKTAGTDYEPGSGIGLILSEALAQRIEGSLSVQSEEGKGSTFTFFIPSLG